MKQTDYASITGALRVAEKKLLQSDGIERVVETSTVADTLTAFSQNCACDFSALKRPSDYESVLSAHLKEVYAELYKTAPYKEVLDIALAKYDYHNIKTALKSKYLGKEDEKLYVSYTQTPPSYIRSFIIDGAKPEKVPEHLIAAAEAGIAAYEESASPQALDIALDNMMFAYLSKRAGESANAFIIEYVAVLIDFYNIKTRLRVKNMDRDLRFLRNALIPGGKFPIASIIEHFDKDPLQLADTFSYKYFGDILKTAVDNYEKTGNFSALERMFDNYLIAHLKASKYISMGPEILLSYVLCKENEARQIRIIMTCKLNGIPNAVLRERLRDNHV